jgi:fibro-slime domain-containing protein
MSPSLNPQRIPSRQQSGFVLALTIILILGVTAISVSTLFNSKTGRMSASNYEAKLKNFLAADGLITLLTQEIINGNGSKYVDMTRYGEIDGHVWIGVTGNSIQDLRNRWITKPTPDLYVTSKYLGKQVIVDNYGTKWFGYLIPPATGNYTFVTRSDDASAFYLSKDTTKNFGGAAPICSLSTWTYDWPTSGSAVSAPISLVEGKRYYFEFYQKQGTGFATGQMGWDGPNQFSERPIIGSHLSRYSSDPVWNGTYTVGGIPVNYQVLGTGAENFSVNAEALSLKVGNASDTVVRTPLNQHISMMGSGIVPPSTMAMRVIYYDYKSDGSNPEFNRPVTLGVRTGMVNSTLTNFTSVDASWFGRATIGKPSRSSTFHPNRSCGLDRWFKDWTSTTQVFRYNAGDNCSQTVFDATGDAWLNVKYKDSLIFKLDQSQGKHTYVYSRMGNYNTGRPETSFRGDASEFFPLDAKGSDPIGSGHNYGFCMEMHTTFTHQSGLIFEFTGDDDAWAYINDQLVIDLGGVHAAENNMLVLDNLPLEFGKTYNFDFFQCERQQVNSSCRIVTNIKMQNNLGKPQANWRRNYGSMN